MSRQSIGTSAVNILVVDDVPDTREILNKNLSAEGYQVFTASSVAEAIRVLDATSVDLVITDIRMPKVSGIELVRHVHENLKDTKLVVITGYPTIEGAVKAVKIGAEEYITKPFTDSELLSTVRRTLDKLRLQRLGQAEPDPAAGTRHGLLGESEPMRGVFKAIAKAASTTATVLITGESGTGKELTARAIHYSSSRAAAPFVPVNCGSIPQNLLESELFGHMKGAFTGATESRAGFFQTADGGTIFLDEISETSLAMQVNLLRVLEEKVVYMVGARREQVVDGRVVAATNKDLLDLVKKGSFREDLFYRLHVITIDMPPLRERGDDILLFVRHFSGTFARELDKPVPRFSDDALEVLMAYHWPGNVRELENVVRRLVLMTDDEVIDTPDLPSLMRFSAFGGTSLNRTLAEVEAEYIRNVLSSVNGNKTQAAKILGLDRKTLREKLRRTEDRSST